MKGIPRVPATWKNQANYFKFPGLESHEILLEMPSHEKSQNFGLLTFEIDQLLLIGFGNAVMLSCTVIQAQALFHTVSLKSIL